MEKLLKEYTFKCKQCGAPLIFDSKRQALICEYCKTVEKIPIKNEKIVEHNFKKALEEIDKHLTDKPLKNFTAKCPVCGGEFELKFYERTTICPYCKSPILTNLDIFYDLHPESLLTFSFDKKRAKELFKNWIGSLWFAPNDLKYMLSHEKIEALYLPYWTYDCDTTSYYEGERGDIYYVYVQKEVLINGVREIRTVREERIRWSFKTGRVSRFFDDVLVGASKTLPRAIINRLSPWDLENLIPFEEKFLTGIKSQTYQVALDEGFKEAQKKMELIIAQDVRNDIGGDRQKIISIKTYYDNVTFKYILLPIYQIKFNYKNKTYQIAINARNGKIFGERPYSYVKIIFTVLGVLLVSALVFTYADFLDSGYDSFWRYLQDMFS